MEGILATSISLGEICRCGALAYFDFVATNPPTTPARSRREHHGAYPAIPNWLDPVGIYEGMMLLRWYGAETNPVPEVERVPVARLYDFLPQDTPRITPAERAATIAARRAAVAARYER